MNRERTVLPTTNGHGKIIQVDFLAAVDPLGLGRERVAVRKKSLPAEEKAFYNKSSNDEYEFTGADLVENAIQGFYDPRYPELYCSGSPQTVALSATDRFSDRICKGVLARRTVDPSHTQVSKVIQTVQKTIKETETTISTPDPSDPRRLRKGNAKKSSEIVDVRVDVKVQEKTLRESPLEIFQRMRRNRIQDRVVYASNLSCHEYLENLRLLRSDSQAAFAALRFAVEAAGAIFGNAAQVLSAVAAGLGGLDGATDKAYYNELAIGVIIEGIETARAQHTVEIKKRQSESIVSYTLETALADAVKYHTACSLRSGLRQAEDSVSKDKKKAEEEAKAPATSDAS